MFLVMSVDAMPMMPVSTLELAKRVMMMTSKMITVAKQLLEMSSCSPCPTLADGIHDYCGSWTAD
jgi:hypothetical protein